ncbi:MAG: ribonuclease Z [Siphonobacter sp.]
MLFQVSILGTGSATPTLMRNPTAQWVTHGDEHFLLDCGEGTQLQLLRYKLRVSRMKHIFISHLHGDHYFGLFGLLTSMNLAQRHEPLRIYGPHGLDEIITTHFKYSDTYLNYPLEFYRTNPNQQEYIFENEHLTIESFPLKHRVACTGFLFREKPKKRNLIRGLVPKEAQPEELTRLKNGQDVYDTTGKLKYSFMTLTTPPPKLRSYAFCSDTLYLPHLAEIVKKVDLLYHEATFANDLKERALKTNHSTAGQAAQVAKDAQAGQLLLGHFSSRYREVDQILVEAKAVFPASILAEEGKTYEVGGSH